MNSIAKQVVDSFKNLVANLGTTRDKQAGGDYYLTTLTDATLSTIYRTSWMGRKCVDIPAKDATRKWREWEADADEINAIEAEEKDHHIPQKIKLALQQSRLFGGAGLYFSIDGDDPSLPLDLATVKEGSLSFVVVLPKNVLMAGDIENDPLSANYGMPKWYTVSSGESGMQQIDPSRVAIFIGNEVLDSQGSTASTQGWGDSVIQAAYEAVRNADATASNIASLVYEAKVDVFGIPDLGDIMANDRTRGLLIDRLELASQLKGNNGTIIRDKDEEYDQKDFTFAGLHEISYQAMQAVSGAADIPLTRFLGQSPGGLNSTGDSDLKNYYDAVNSMQTLIMTPALRNLDECLIRSALGDRPDEIGYSWSSLWQMTDAEKSKISLETSQTIKNLADTNLYPDDDLAEATANMLVEHSILPTFEFTGTPDNDETGIDAIDATPRSLYVYRRVLNAADIIEWAREQGFKQALSANDMHVTIAYSKALVDWVKMGEDWASDERGQLRIKAGGARAVEHFGDQAKVLVFASRELKWRHDSMRNRGASWDYDDYESHITITYGEAPADVEPYQGPIVLGSEIFEEIDPRAQIEIKEIKL